MKLTLRSGHETARLNGTAAGDGTAEFGCHKHYAGLRMKEVMVVAELQWMEGRGVQNGTIADKFCRFLEEAEAASTGEVCTHYLLRAIFVSTR